MRTIRLGFADTYENAKKFFTFVLSKRYNVVRDDENPRYLIFGDRNFGETHYKYGVGVNKIFFTGENIRPDYFTYDHAITFDHENSSKHYRLPLYILEMWAIMQDNNVDGKYTFQYLKNRDLDPEKEWEKKTRFAAYIQSNPNCGPRTKFVEYLQQQNAVDCAGPHLNNVGYIIPRDRNLKLKFFNEAKYGIAFENGSYPGYVTEKLIDCYYANTIPIYWGSSTIGRDFNTNSMIIFNENDSVFEFYRHLKDIASNKNRYLDILTASPFKNNILNDMTYYDNFLNWFDNFVYEG